MAAAERRRRIGVIWTHGTNCSVTPNAEMAAAVEVVVTAEAVAAESVLDSADKDEDKDTADDEGGKSLYKSQRLIRRFGWE